MSTNKIVYSPKTIAKGIADEFELSKKDRRKLRILIEEALGRLAHYQAHREPHDAMWYE